MQTTTAADPATQLQAVCYKCSYVGLQATSGHKCPLCGYLLITESRDVQPQKAITVRDVLDRSTVETVGAPALPGVGRNDDELPTTVQIIKRASPPMTPRLGTGTTALRRSRSKLAVSLALAGALVAGLAAAMLVHGGF